MAKAHVLTTDLCSSDEHIVDVVFPNKGIIVVDFDEALVAEARQVLDTIPRFVGINVQCTASFPDNEGLPRYEVLTVYRGSMSFRFTNDNTGDEMYADIISL